MSINFLNAEFVRSAADASGFPADDMPRCVFAGRSNVGKSSTINTLLARKNIARVSATPGKTVFVNLFLIDRRLWLVDLPGYGYSRTGKQERQRYSQLIDSYFSADMGKISRIYHIVDARHKPTGDDCLMMDWIRNYGLSATIIANKADKLKKNELEGNMNLIRQTLLLGENDLLIPFSAEKKTNRERVLQDINAAVADHHTARRAESE